MSTVDRTAQRITLTRNPKWWGAPPLLDSITFLVLDDAARIPALQNNTIDATGLTSLDELTIARGTPGIAIRRAPGLSWYHFTFNGAPGSILADKALRLAISRGIDRQTIADVSQRGLADKPAALNNHIYVAGQKGYQDNSAVVAFDPEKAKQELDALGWRMNGQFREKDGRQLVIRDVYYDAQTTKQIGQIAQNSLAQIGVKLDLVTAAGGRLFTDYVTVGNFDIAQFAWGADAFALCCLTQIYTTGADSNFGKISSPEIDANGQRDSRRARPRQGAHACQRTRQADLGRGFQPAAVSELRKRRGAKHFGELRRIRSCRRGLHQDRLHEAVTRCTVRGTAAGNACSTAAAAAMPQINRRTPRPPGVESSFLARAGRPELVPS